VNEDKMDERDLEEEGKDRKRKGWGNEKKMTCWNWNFFVLTSSYPLPHRPIDSCPSSVPFDKRCHLRLATHSTFTRTMALTVNRIDIGRNIAEQSMCVD
jgi:hypothetical protein